MGQKEQQTGRTHPNCKPIPFKGIGCLTLPEAPCKSAFILFPFQRLFRFRFHFLNCLNLSSLEGGHVATNLLFNSRGDISVLTQKFFRVLSPLAKANIANIEPGTALFEETHLQTEINETTFAGNTLVIHNIELSSLEGGSNLVLHHTHSRAVSHYVLSQ